MKSVYSVLSLLAGPAAVLAAPQDYGSYSPYASYGSYGSNYASYGTYGNPPSNVALTLSNIVYNSSYTYSTPAHLATKGGYLSFTLTNSAVGYSTNCYASSTREFNFFYGDQVYQCNTPDGQGPPAAASFTFSQPSNTFAVNQTYAYGGSNFVSSGSGVANLQCTTTTDKNPNWQVGQIYSTTSTVCQPGSLTISNAATVGA